MTYTIEDAHRLAQLASVDVRTAMRFLLGGKVKHLAHSRLQAALDGYVKQPETLAISSKEPQQA